MNIVAGTAPFNRAKRSTTQIMVELLIGLGVIFLASVIFNFTLGVNYGIKTILIMLIAVVTSLVGDLIAGALRYNKSKHGPFDKYIVSFILQNFSVVTAVIFALTLPVGTPYYVVIVGSLFATLVVKHTFGGFGNNIFNPAALARLFVALAFGPSLVGYLSDADKSLGGLKAGITVTGQYVADGGKWLTGALSNTNVSMLDLYLGKYSAALGETFTILILVVGFVLALRNVINWRTPVFLFGTVLISSVFISLVTGFPMGEYILLQFGLGGLAFGAIFMFTDPVTSPTSNFGKALIGILGGLFNVLIRVAGSFPEGTAFSIALVNVFSPMIDRLYAGRTNMKIWRHYAVSGGALAVSVGILTGVSAGKLPKPEPLPDIVPFVVYEGKSNVQDPLSNPEKQFTVNVKVGLSEVYEIVTLEVADFSTPNRFTDGALDNLISYYTSITLEEFKALPAPSLSAGATSPGQSGDYILTNNIYTSLGIYEAISDAVGNLDVYHGEAEEVEVFSHGYSAGKFKAKVGVYLNEYYDIVNLTIENGSTTEAYLNEAARTRLINYYKTLSVAEFKALPAPQVDLELEAGPTVPGQEGDYIISGSILSSRAIFNAISDALKDINVYEGEDFDYPRSGLDEGDEYKMLMKVNVYVNKETNKIKTAEVVEGGSTSNWKDRWEKALPHIIRKYYDLSVADLLAMTSHLQLYPGDSEIHANVSVSPSRLFHAVQNALEGYYGG